MKYYLLQSNLPCQASANVMLLPLPVPFPMKEYFPSQLRKNDWSDYMIFHLLRVSAVCASLSMTPVVVSAGALSSVESHLGKDLCGVEFLRIGLELRTSQGFDFLEK